jgi:hypothetical protein
VRPLRSARTSTPTRGKADCAPLTSSYLPLRSNLLDTPWYPFGSCSRRHKTGVTSPIRGASPNRDDANPSPNPNAGRQRHRNGGGGPTTPYVPRPAGNPSGRTRARLSAPRRCQRSRGRVPSVLRPSSPPPDRRMPRKKGRQLEPRLQLWMCAWLSSVGFRKRTESQRASVHARSSQWVNASDGECFVICGCHLAHLQKYQATFF